MAAVAEISRVNDIARGDACLPSNRPGGYYQNPIETWFDNPDLILKYGVDGTQQLRDWAKAKAPLDPRKDEPLPNWAIDVLRLGRIGYKGRIKIVMQHADDILRFRINKNRKG